MHPMSGSAGTEELASKSIEIVQFKGRPVLARRATIPISQIAQFVPESVTAIMKHMDKASRPMRKHWHSHD